MGSIRPLFTITVLVVVGAYLYCEDQRRPCSAAPRSVMTKRACRRWPPQAVARRSPRIAPRRRGRRPHRPPRPRAVLPLAAASPGNASAESDSGQEWHCPRCRRFRNLPELPKTADVTPPAARCRRTYRRTSPVANANELAPS